MATAAEKKAAQEAEAGKSLVKSSENANAVGDVIDYSLYAEDRGAGFENQTSEDIAVPFIEVLQAQSPEVLVEDGPKAGTFINRTTGEIWSGKDGIPFIPVTTQHVFVEWVPREKGGGIVTTYELDDPIVKKVRAEQPLGKYAHPSGNGNDLIETFYIYGLFVDPSDGNIYPAVMAFNSTRIKAYKDWMFRARSIVIPLPDGRKLTKLPLFSHRYRLTTSMVENTKGKWFAITARFDGDNAEQARIAPNSDVYVAAKNLLEDINQGKKVADTSSVGDRAENVDASPNRGDTGAADAPY